jgi:hypothetical protein
MTNENIHLPERISRFSLILAALSMAVIPGYGQIPGPSTNMVTGTTWPGGDPYLQRQNEPSMAVSSRNGLHLLAGSNDYRSVDIPFASGNETGDAWLGLYKSFDGGLTWTSNLVPGYPQDNSAQGNGSPLKGLSAAADPLVRAGTNGLFYYSGIAFSRTPGGPSKVFVARFIDDNNFQGGDTIRYVGTSTIATGNATNFLDKPSIAVDIPRAGSQICTIPAGSGAPGQTFHGGRIYAAYTAFAGGQASSTSAIMLTQSNDCGVSWTPPVQISSKSVKTNQGASLAINPSTGDLYVIWRIFASNASGAFPPSADGIGATVRPYTIEPISENSFTAPAVRLATYVPFDQGTSAVSFRTNGYPTMAIDGSGHIYVAWAQRGLGTGGDSRIVVASGNVRTNPFDIVDLLFPRITAPAVIEADATRGHQIMPALEFSSGKLTAVWYDFRDDDEVAIYHAIGGGKYSFSLMLDGLPSFTNYIADPSPDPATHQYKPTDRRQTVEVRAAQAPPGVPAKFGPSVIVSQYAFGTPANDNSGEIEQLEFDAPNLPMFQQGQVPFFGDYIDVAGPTFVPTATGWRFNTLATDPDFTRPVWTDNRNVIQPADGNWANYTPPATGGPSIFDPTQMRSNCVTGVSNTGDRNQDIYTAALTPGLVVGAKGNSKQLSTTLQREFPVTVQNFTAATKFYRLTIASQPPGGVASFLQTGATVLQLDLSIPPQSSASRSVFIKSSVPTATVPVSVHEISGVNGTLLPGGLSGAVSLNSDTSNPSISNPSISNQELYNPSISNPSISNPSISNPSISNPSISNPSISNINIANPSISNPSISNPSISNPSISNPSISNPSISNPSISNSSLSDTSYNVTNTGNTSSAYSLQLLLNQALPNQVIVQAIVSKVYTTPVANGCALAVEAHYQPILNNTNPIFTNTPGGSGPLDPAAPTFALEPGETVVVTIRVYQPTPATFNPLAITPVVVSNAANTGTTQPPLTLTITTATLPAAKATVAYSQQLQAVGGTGTGYRWTATGALPTGLSLTAGGLLSGTPTIAGTNTFTLKVTDSGANTASRSYSLVVTSPVSPLAITTVPPVGFQANLFPATAMMATGGMPPYLWTVAQPDGTGLFITPSGVLTGSVLGGLNGAPVTATVIVTDSTPNTPMTAAMPVTLLPNCSYYVPCQSSAGLFTTSISNVLLTTGNANGTQVVATVGSNVTVSLNAQVSGPAGTTAMESLVIGFANGTGPGSSTCSAIQVNGAPVQLSVTLTTPSTPGRYYVAYHTQGSACTPLVTTDGFIGVVDVLPVTVTEPAGTATFSITGVNLTPYSGYPYASYWVLTQPTNPPFYNNVNFSFSRSLTPTGSSAGVEFGLNIDSSPSQCRGFNVDLTGSGVAVPLLQGRYYISVDAGTACPVVTGMPSWFTGIPGANFNKFIGVIDVQVSN